MTINVHVWKFADRETFPLAEWVNSLSGELMFVSAHPFNASAMWAITKPRMREIRHLNLYDAANERLSYRDWLNTLPGRIVHIHHARDLTEVVSVTQEEIDD